MRAKLVRKFDAHNTGTLKADVELGTIYNVDITYLNVELLLNSETGKVVAVPHILATRAEENGGKPGWMPLDMLEILECTPEEMEAEGFVLEADDKQETPKYGVN